MKRLIIIACIVVIGVIVAYDLVRRQGTGRLADRSKQQESEAARQAILDPLAKPDLPNSNVPAVDADKANPAAPSATRLMAIQSRLLYEVSGIDQSPKYPGNFWVHNDSGSDPELFLVDSLGATRLTVLLDGVQNRDFENLTTWQVNSKAWIAVGDFGDNLRKRKSFQIHVLEEPVLKERVIRTQIRPLYTLECTFEDGVPRDCEAMAFIDKPDRLLICSKPRLAETLSGKSAELFEVVLPHDRKKRLLSGIIARKVGDVAGGLITGMDYEPNRHLLVIRNYLQADLYSIDPQRLRQSVAEQKNKSVILPVQRQGEAICFVDNGRSVVITSEGKQQDVIRIRLSYNGKSIND